MVVSWINAAGQISGFETLKQTTKTVKLHAVPCPRLLFASWLAKVGLRGVPCRRTRTTKPLALCRWVWARSHRWMCRTTCHQWAPKRTGGLEGVKLRQTQRYPNWQTCPLWEESSFDLCKSQPLLGIPHQKQFKYDGTDVARRHLRHLDPGRSRACCRTVLTWSRAEFKGRCS